MALKVKNLTGKGQNIKTAPQVSSPAFIQLLIVLVSLPATWRSTTRTAACQWRCGTGTWPAATTSWDRCPSASQSSRNKEWMDGEMKEGMDGGRRGGGGDAGRRNSTGRGGGRVKVTLFITALLEKYFSWSSSFYSGDTQCQSISTLSLYLLTSPPSHSLVQSLYLSIFLSFLLTPLCQGF